VPPWLRLFGPENDRPATLQRRESLSAAGETRVVVVQEACVSRPQQTGFTKGLPAGLVDKALQLVRQPTPQPPPQLGYLCRDFRRTSPRPRRCHLPLDDLYRPAKVSRPGLPVRPLGFDLLPQLPTWTVTVFREGVS
jgi:hypothetical protein